LLKRLFSARNFRLVEHFRSLAEKHDVSLSQFALSWVLNQPAVTSAILGASKVHHVIDAVAISDWQWPEELLREVDQGSSE